MVGCRVKPGNDELTMTQSGLSNISGTIALAGAGVAAFVGCNPERSRALRGSSDVICGIRATAS